MEYNERPFTHFFLDFICNHSTSGLWKKDVALCPGNETPNSLAQGQSRITCRAVSVWLQLGHSWFIPVLCLFPETGPSAMVDIYLRHKKLFRCQNEKCRFTNIMRMIKATPRFCYQTTQVGAYVCVSWKFNLIKDFKPVANLQSFRNFNTVPYAISIFLHFFKWDKRNQFLNF